MAYISSSRAAATLFIGAAILSLAGNSANSFGGGIRTHIDSSLTVTNTGFCDNTPDQINGGFTDGGGNSLLYCPPPIPKPDPCPADTDGDGDVDIHDFLAVIAAWGACP